MTPLSRFEQFSALFPNEKLFRWKQLSHAFFDPVVKNWQGVTVLPKPMREELAKQIPWVSYRDSKVFSSANEDTYKAILTLADKKQVETVLMANKRDQWTICVSSQVGCAMKCAFCATGKMGLIRSLSADEIMDQYRFWRAFLNEGAIGESRLQGARISNVVFMGMGEPLANYEAVKTTLKTWLSNTDLGPTHITVSTVGVLPILEKLLSDPEWPAVRMAISLHSADPKTRHELVPSSHDLFIPQLKKWAKKYLKNLGNRRHHLTFEYVMLQNVNDTDHHAETLTNLVRSLGQIKVNLIPYNFTDSEFQRSADDRIERFKTFLETHGVDVMVRRTMGDDIAAACGQLITKEGSGRV
ncbi:23S rRNA (adenine(2503)-C(2))-methyltransferase RlmN [Candidatus Peregrinibacteria bacterium]|nr:23S rRNA (adenine(2503)-C(2))-methyltransferase RlmN [Candidatus Peregrinibacteria bacterium]